MAEDSLSELLTIEDKGFEDFIPTLDHPGTDFFDQYVDHDYDSFDSKDGSNNSNGSNVYDTDFSSFEMEQSSNSSVMDSSSSNTSKSQQQPVHIWRHDSWQHQKVEPFPQTQKLVHRNRLDGLAITGTELLGLEGKIPSKAPIFTTASLQPGTPPSTPIRNRQFQTAPGFINPATFEQSNETSHVISTVSANMESPYTGQDSPSFWEWTGRFQQFSLQLPSDAFPFSPPPSGRAPSFDPQVRFSTSHHDGREGMTKEALSTPTLRRDSRTVSRNHVRSPSGLGTTTGTIPPPQDPFQSSQVNPQPYQWLSQPDEEETDLLSPLFQAPDPWVMEAHAHAPPFSSDAYNFSLPLDMDFASQGLMIQTEGIECTDFLSPMSPSTMNFGEDASASRPSQPRYQTPPSPPVLHPICPPPVPPPSTCDSHAQHHAPTRRSSRPNMGISASSSSSSSLLHRRTKSSIHSSSSSHANGGSGSSNNNNKAPTHVKSAPSLSLSSSSQHPHNYHHRRHLSYNINNINNTNNNLLLPSPPLPPIPIAPSASTSSPPHTFGYVHNNSSTNSIGFVNFTPSDSKRILTGVAPSGSSKTKARREKEAGEKRRKLSEVAMRAMEEVGAHVDLERLRREGLLV